MLCQGVSFHLPGSLADALCLRTLRLAFVRLHPQQRPTAHRVAVHDTSLPPGVVEVSYNVARSVKQLATYLA